MRRRIVPRALLAGVLAACAAAPATSVAPAPRAPPETPVLAEAAAYESAARVARSKFIAEDYAGSVEAFRRALTVNPGDAQVQYWIARAAMRANDPAGAVAALQQIADTGGDVTPFADHFIELRDQPAYREVAARLAAGAARHRHAVEAFRIPEAGLLVEGIAYDPVGRAFYVGSGTRRKLIKVVEGRPPEDFVAPRADLDSIGGVRVDAARRRLWAVSGTDERMDGYIAGEPARNALVEIDLETSAVAGIYRLGLPGRHVLNDVAVDGRGRPFATDTADGHLYTLTADGQSLAAVFDAQPYFRPNGIAADDAGAVLFVADATGVHRFDIAAHTTRRIAQPPGSALGQLDGMYFVRAAHGAQLVGIQGIGTGRVIALDLSPRLDAVVRVHVLESDHPRFDGPTTGAVVGSQLYFIANSQLWAPRPPRETVILKVPLDAR
ncbi:MAG TPA: tetratricopeptide repeat protein [Kofleriaceae bacterium]|nr:tetratricopeptide repeat protein [Kofleriaceae bacterium]